MEDSEIRAFWNAFAAEYHGNEKERPQLPVAEMLVDYLKAAGIIPCERLLDLAGGTGSYFPAFRPYTNEYILMDISDAMLAIAKSRISDPKVTFIRESQAVFLEEQPDNSYQLVFTAMNPALDQPEELRQLERIATKGVAILRLVAVEDELFSPFEPSGFSTKEMDGYREALEGLGIRYEVKRWRFTSEETISPEFYREYFREEYSREALEAMIEELFPEGSRSNSLSYEYQLIFWRPMAH